MPNPNINLNRAISEAFKDTSYASNADLKARAFKMAKALVIKAQPIPTEEKIASIIRDALEGIISRKFPDSSHWDKDREKEELACAFFDTIARLVGENDVNPSFLINMVELSAKVSAFIGKASHLHGNGTLGANLSHKWWEALKDKKEEWWSIWSKESMIKLKAWALSQNYFNLRAFAELIEEVKGSKSKMERFLMSLPSSSPDKPFALQ